MIIYRMKIATNFSVLSLFRGGVAKIDFYVAEPHAQEQLRHSRNIKMHTKIDFDNCTECNFNYDFLWLKREINNLRFR